MKKTQALNLLNRFFDDDFSSFPVEVNGNFVHENCNKNISLFLNLTEDNVIIESKLPLPLLENMGRYILQLNHDSNLGMGKLYLASDKSVIFYQRVNLTSINEENISTIFTNFMADYFELKEKENKL